MTLLWSSTTMTSRRYILLVVSVAVFVGRAAAQSCVCVDRAIPVYIYAKHPGPALVLKPADFKVSVRGIPIAVTEATAYRGPLRIVILIDASRSMTEEGKLTFALAFARDLISVSPPQTSLALLTFSDRIEDTVPFGRSRADLLAEIDNLQSTNWAGKKGLRRTAIWDSLQCALALLQKPRLGDAVCLATDGVDNASHSSKSSVRIRLESAGVRLYTVVFVPNTEYRGLTAEEVDAPSEMRALADATGGAFAMFMPRQFLGRVWPVARAVPILDSDEASLSDVARTFYGELSSFVELEVRLPSPLVKPRALKLEMVDASGRKEKDLQAVYPHQLAPCAPKYVR